MRGILLSLWVVLFCCHYSHLLEIKKSKYDSILPLYTSRNLKTTFDMQFSSHYTINDYLTENIFSSTSCFRRMNDEMFSSGSKKKDGELE